MENVKAGFAKVYLQNKQDMEAAKTEKLQENLFQQYIGFMRVAKDVLQWSAIDFEEYIKEEEEKRAEAERQEWQSLSIAEKFGRVNKIVSDRDSKRALSSSIQSLCRDLDYEARKYPELAEAIDKDLVFIHCPSEYYMPCWKLERELF